MGEASNCVGCGYCCIQAPCAVALRVYGPVDECPALTWEVDRYRCKLALLPGSLGENFRKELVIGTGCSSSLNDWRRDVRPRPRPKAVYHVNPLPALLQRFIRSAVRGDGFMSSDKMWLILTSFRSELEGDYSQQEIDDILSATAAIMTESRSSRIRSFAG